MRQTETGADFRRGFLGLHFPRVWRRNADGPVSVASSVLGFALSGLAALALVTVGVIYYARDTATDEAIRDSIRLTEVVSRGLVEPALDDGIITGDREALQRLDDVVQNRVLGSSVVRVKLWTREGPIDAGAVGYLLKDAAPDELLRGIRAAARGESPLSPKAAQAVLAARKERLEASELSPHETDVLVLVAKGLANKQIAQRLGISEKTVKAHLVSVFQRIGVSDRTQAAVWAHRRGLLDS